MKPRRTSLALYKISKEIPLTTLASQPASQPASKRVPDLVTRSNATQKHVIVPKSILPANSLLVYLLLNNDNNNNNYYYYYNHYLGLLWMVVGGTHKVGALNTTRGG